MAPLANRGLDAAQLNGGFIENRLCVFGYGTKDVSVVTH